jgi:flagellar biosynthetic protein FliR
VTLSIAPDLLVGFLFALVRTSAWITLAPPFSSATIPNRVKVVIAAAIAMVLAPQVQGRTGLFDLVPFTMGIAYQAFIGIALGFTVLMIFSAVQAAGELIDMFSGFTAAQIYDPFSNATSSPFGRLYQMVAVGLLFATNGHLMIVEGFMRSFTYAPLAGPRLDDLSRLVTRDVGGLVVSAIEMAAPLLAALFLTELTLGLLGKAAPQTNILQISFAVKIFLVLLLAGIALPLLPGAVGDLVPDIVRTSTHLVMP